MNMQKTTLFREQYRLTILPKHYSGIAHALFAALVLGGSSVFSLMHVQGPVGGAWLTIPITLIFGNLVEYYLHRFPLHHRMPGSETAYTIHTLQHHRFFTEDMPAYESTRDFHMVFFPWWASLFAVACIAPVAYFILNPLLGSNVAWLFAATGSGHFIFYEVMHFFHHYPHKHEPQKGWWAFMRKHHASHHDMAWMAHYNFNVTFPLGDLLFGTLKRKP